MAVPHLPACLYIFFMLFKHLCLNNIKKIYKHAGKCDDQKNQKYMLDADMVSTPEEVTDDSPSFTMTSTPVKK